MTKRSSCAAAIGNTRLASELEVLLALGAAHGTETLISALHRAVAFRRFRAADVRSILAAGTGTPQPRPSRGCAHPRPAGCPDPLPGRL